MYIIYYICILHIICNFQSVFIRISHSHILMHPGSLQSSVVGFPADAHQEGGSWIITFLGMSSSLKIVLTTYRMLKMRMWWSVKKSEDWMMIGPKMFFRLFEDILVQMFDSVRQGQNKTLSESLQPSVTPLRESHFDLVSHYH